MDLHTMCFNVLWGRRGTELLEGNTVPADFVARTAIRPEKMNLLYNCALISCLILLIPRDSQASGQSIWFPESKTSLLLVAGPPGSSTPFTFPDCQGDWESQHPSAQVTHMEIALEQGGVDDL